MTQDAAALRTDRALTLPNPAVLDVLRSFFAVTREGATLTRQLRQRFAGISIYCRDP
jgi:hypothetical protein